MFRQVVRAGQRLGAQGAQSSAFKNFATDFVQGAIEDEVKSRMGCEHVQTGAPTAGGTAAGILRMVVKNALTDTPPHTPRQQVATFQAYGMPMTQAVSLLGQDPFNLHNATLQTLFNRQLMSIEEAATVQRAYVTRDPLLRAAEAVVTSEQQLQAAKAEQAKAEAVANMSIAEIMESRGSESSGGAEAKD